MPSALTNLVLKGITRSPAACSNRMGNTSVDPGKYHVFLSFRVDTRNNISDFIYKRLKAGGIDVFRDKEDLRGYDRLKDRLLEAVSNCRIAIPIISPRYAESTWCLLELTAMMKCHKEHGKPVFPVFYKVDVGDVGCQRGKFGKALCKLERKYSLEQVQEWREALTSVSKIGGWTSQTISDWGKVELVEMVFEKVWSELNMMWIKQLPMSIGSVYVHFLEKKKRGSRWQVYLVFCGPHIQYGLADYLRTSLMAAGIRVFSIDDQSLIGKNIANEICKATNECKIFLPILTKNFASSRFCLEELAQMVECQKTKEINILPIYYKVNRSQLLDVAPCFRKHMLRHKALEDKSTYEQWERALRVVGSFNGWVSNNRSNRDEGKLVVKVVEEVLRLLSNP